MFEQEEKNLGPVGKRIEAVRLSREGYSKYRLARDAAINYSQLNRIMTGKSGGSFATLLRICQALKCSHEEAETIFSLTQYRVPSQDELDTEPSAIAS